MRYYYLTLQNDKILGSIDTFEEQKDMIEISYEEYQQAKLYSNFNSGTREFSEPKPLTELPLNQDDLWKTQVEQAIGTLAEQVAKNTLLTGDNQ